MNRQSEVEVFGATLDSSLRLPIQRGLLAQRQGNLSLAAQIMANGVSKDARLKWPALLLALDAVELKMAGSVACQTPKSRYAASETKPNFEECWGAFKITVWPDQVSMKLQLVPEKGRMRLMRLQAIVAPSVSEAVRVVADEVSAYLGCTIETA